MIDSSFCRRPTAADSNVRRGFSVVELLVVIAIISVLLGLLIPAVQRARETALRMSCLHNLKEIVLAAHTFEAKEGALPPGMDIRHAGPLVRLLPHLDQTAQYGIWSDDKNYVYWWLNPENRPPIQGPPWENFPFNRPKLFFFGAEARLSILTCPSNPIDTKPNDTKTTQLMTVTRGLAGQDFTPGLPTNWNLYCGGPGNLVLGGTHYAGVAGDLYFHSQKYRGIFTYNRRLRLTDIHDGTSNTLMFGEVAGGEVDFGTGPLKTVPAFAIGGLWLTDGLNEGRNYPDPTDFGSNNFGGPHGDFVHFAFADGSVRPLKYIGMYNRDSFHVLLALGGTNDGEVVPGDF